jgi:hypothetical protein
MFDGIQLFQHNEISLEWKNEFYHSLCQKGAD